jgi:hypothetical protein
MQRDLKQSLKGFRPLRRIRLSPSFSTVKLSILSRRHSPAVSYCLSGSKRLHLGLLRETQLNFFMLTPHTCGWEGAFASQGVTADCRLRGAWLYYRLLRLLQRTGFTARAAMCLTTALYSPRVEPVPQPELQLSTDDSLLVGPMLGPSADPDVTNSLSSTLS